MIIKNNNRVLSQSGIFYNRSNYSCYKNDGGSNVYRVYVGDQLVYPHSGFLPDSDPLSLPYRLVVSYEYIYDRLTPKIYGGQTIWSGEIATTNRVITIETSFPCFVRELTSFPDYVNLYDTSVMPHINVRQALAVVLPIIERGSWVHGYFDNDPRGPTESNNYQYWRMPAEADATFIHEQTSSYKTNKDGIRYDEKSNGILYIGIPQTYKWGFSITRPIIEEYDDERLVQRTKLYPDSYPNLLINTSKNMLYFHATRDTNRNQFFHAGFPGGLGSVPFNVDEAYQRFGYPMINQLVDGVHRQYCPGRLHSLTAYGEVPFYEMFNGSIKGPEAYGCHNYHYCSYIILENTNPHFDSYEDWSRKVRMLDELGV
jgi:hypothetical protein